MFPSKEFQAKAKQFVLVKIDVDKDPKAADAYDVAGIPDIQFLSPKGELVHRAVGFRGKEGILAEMDTAQAKMKG